MASPFRMFRKNQKVMMAVVTVLAMFAFVFLGSWSRMGGPSNAIQNPEVFSWKYGTVHKSDLQNQRYTRQLVHQFLLAAAQVAGEDPRQVDMYLSRAFPLTDQGIVNSLVLQKKADDLGIVISDKVVNDFIRGWTGDRVKPQQFAEIIASLSTDRRAVSASHVFDALRFELAALKVQELFRPVYSRVEGMNPVFRGDTPADRWDYFCRLNRKVTAEMLPLPVEKFVAETPDPTESQLVAFYDQYKDSFPQLGSPTPGFKQPLRVQFQYFKAANEKLIAQELPKVTEQEIKDYYDRYKDVFFKKNQLPDEPGSGTSGGKAGDKPSDKAGDAKSGGDKGGQKTDGGKPDESKKSSGKKQSSAVPRGKSLNGELLALADDAQIELAQAAKGGAAKADAAKSDSPKAADKSATDQSAGGKDSKSGDANTPPPQRPVEYEPLSKVTDKIRNSVAAQKVERKVDDAFNALRTQMDRFGRAMDIYHRNQTRGDTSAKTPAPLDFAALAKQYGLEAKQTEMITDAQANGDTDIGKSHQLVPGSYNITQFVQMAFQPNYPKYQTQETEDLEKNRYLWWKTGDQQVRVPPLNDIKADVVHAWKMIEARKSAQTKADEYASEARRLQKPLKEIFKAQAADLFTAGPFSWLSRRTSDPNSFPMLTEVSGVKDAGSDFMRAVFALAPGQAGVAANQPLTIYYVVQIESEEPKQAELREQFLASMETPQSATVYAMIAASDNANMGAAWFKEIENEFGLKMASGQTPSAAEQEMD